MLLYSLSFFWWNVGLSPAAKGAVPKATDEIYGQLVKQIRLLAQRYNFDFLALCEVSEKDITHLETELKLSQYSILDLTYSEGKTRFDICVIYKNTKISVAFQNNIVRKIQNNTIKAGQSLRVTNVDDNSSIIVYVCHWPSRMISENENKRIISAQAISYFACENIANGDDVIIMGDFNDNPFDKSIYDELKAIRCTERVKQFPLELFYNPFWRYLTSDERYSHLTTSGKYNSGTYKYSNIKGNWHLFDQMLISGSLLGSSIWHLNESETRVLNSSEFIDLLDGKDKVMDHLPISCQLVRP